MKVSSLIAKRAALLVLLIAGILWGLPALDLEARLSPALVLPLGADADLFRPGGGANLFAGIGLGPSFAPGLEAEALALPMPGLTSMAIVTSGGPGFHALAYPFSRLRLNAVVFGGGWLASFNDSMAAGLWWGGGGGLGWRLSPSFTLGADVRYHSFSGLYNGVSIGLGAEISLGLGKGGASGLDLAENQQEVILPFRYWAYAKESVGSVTVTNRESAEIREVTVSLAVPGYDSGALVCAKKDLLQRGASFEVPIVAALSENALSLTEAARIQAVLTVEYRLLDAPRESKKTIALRFENRNALPWKDDREAAAFASPQDPAVLDLSKFVAGLVRNRSKAELGSSVSFAAGFFEALRLSNIAYTPDPARPFATRQGGDKADYLQYPYQTIAYRGGDVDDLAVLYAALLESVGAKSAMIFLQDEVLVAFSVGKDENAVRSQYSSMGDLVSYSGEFWAPLKMTRLRDGFLRAWQEGASAWRAATAAGKEPTRFTLAEAWKAYPPVGIPGVEAKVQKPTEEAVLRAFDTTMRLLATREIAPKVKAIADEIGAGAGTGRQRNSLGILYARYGMFPEASREFAQAVTLGYGSANINLGNVLFLLGDFKGAAQQYQLVLDRKPTDKTALIGMARAKYELDAFAESDQLFAKARGIDPAYAERFAYLAARTDPSARAAAADEGGAIPWAEDE